MTRLWHWCYKHAKPVLEKTNFCATGNLTWNFLKIETTSTETTSPGLLCIWIWTFFTSATQTVPPNWVSMIGCVSSRFHCLFACDHNPPFNYEALATAVAWVSGEIAHKCVEQDTCYLPEIGPSFWPVKMKAIIDCKKMDIVSVTSLVDFWRAFLKPKDLRHLGSASPCVTPG